MSCNDPYTITIAQGEIKSTRFTVKDKTTGDLVNLDNFTIFLNVVSYQDTDTKIIEKVSTDPLQIEILPQTGTTEGQFMVHWSGSDTDSLAVDVYCYDLWITNVLGKKRQWIAPSDLDVTESLD